MQVHHPAARRDQAKHVFRRATNRIAGTRIGVCGDRFSHRVTLQVSSFPIAGSGYRAASDVFFGVAGRIERFGSVTMFPGYPVTGCGNPRALVQKTLRGQLNYVFFVALIRAS